MTSRLTDADLRAALQHCADEPVHIPGTIQPFGCLLAVSVDTGLVQYVSENAADFLDRPAIELFGQAAPEVLGGDIWHGVRNAIARKEIRQKTIPVGKYPLGERLCAVHVHQSNDSHVIEIEPATEIGLEGTEALKTLGFLMAQIQSCATEQDLFDLTCELAQHLSGYDRVLVYRFDAEFNGEVLAEVKRGPQESFLGLRFPHWDIPAQARAIMERLPLRFIQDVDQQSVPILAAAGSEPLDISLASVRGVSPVHMEYLRNMGTAATMTLSVMLEGRLWGIISFHHRHHKVPSPDLREVLVSFLMVFNGKLVALRQQAALNRIAALDSGFVGQSEETQPIEQVIPSVAPLILDVMKADGIAAFTSEDVTQAGNVPGQEALARLSDLALSSGEPVAIDSLAERFPELTHQLGNTAGALVVGVLPDRAICIFRNEISREIAWAGDPEKKIEKVDDRVRLSPRGSFSTFLELVQDRAEPWSDNDIYLIHHLRTLLQAAERQAMMDTLNRQQALMIGELNHRVRNILALVRSVSRQARRRYGSLNSYANAIENRIRALAAAHDLSGGRSTEPVSIIDLMQLEFEPFSSVAEQQIMIEGPNRYMKPEIAPIVSLVIHELTTNAAKYGALSEAEGRVLITLTEDADGMTIRWHETGGPKVVRPNEHGFGMALIEQAVPHELAGSAKIEFEPDGFRATFMIPAKHFVGGTATHETATANPIVPEKITRLPDAFRLGTVLVLEDNFIIAREMADQLRDLGYEDVRTAANVQAALELHASETLVLAVLDVNLGPDQTSEAIALSLFNSGIPFVFVTGYGEKAPLPESLSTVPRLTKPITSSELFQAIAILTAS